MSFTVEEGCQGMFLVDSSGVVSNDTREENRQLADGRLTDLGIGERSSREVHDYRRFKNIEFISGRSDILLTMFFRAGFSFSLPNEANA